MGLQLVHSDQPRPAATVLRVFRDRIVAEIDGVALRVGMLLREARSAAPEEFARWVDKDLPFGMETARRLMAISAAYEKLPAETLRNLPRPWQAMYALKELPTRALEDGIARGYINPEMSVEQAKRYARAMRGKQFFLYRRVDLTAGRLMRAEPTDLSEAVRNSLRAWLSRAD